MTKQLKKAVEIIIGNLNSKNVLEIGSRQEKNQSEIADLRALFANAKYLGTDMRPGPGVDKVIDAEKLPFKDKEFDLVVSLETFEHARRPWVVAEQIRRVISDDGIVIISSQQNMPIHLHPSDYFRYTPFGLASFFSDFKTKLVVAISPPYLDEVKLNPLHIIVIASKSKMNEKLFRKIKQDLIANKNLISVHKPYRHRLEDMIKYIKRGLAEAKFRQELEFFDPE